ncbi:MAG: hypothetical protein Harvfovirus16_9 [Harvfovirus sp.]|uniref:Uncharacterized protein n=1 Tax=Harvfovirus sp. TaxID=2487768 RepID=A0A3G5A1K7_9VIRU|nr:MAG: hypothetical protein Harvfovirus16_9 [Harvfovirus sp.]
MIKFSNRFVKDYKKVIGKPLIYGGNLSPYASYLQANMWGKKPKKVCMHHKFIRSHDRVILWNDVLTCKMN